MANISLKRIIDNDCITINCRGRKIDTYVVENSKTLTKSRFNESTLYLSLNQPIAIVYSGNKPNVMRFKKVSNSAVNDKIKLRESIKFVSLAEKEFNSVLFMLLSGNDV